MFRYYSWALAEKSLSFVPGGSVIYSCAGTLVNKNRKGYGQQFVTSFPLARKVKELVPSGGTVLDLGTGWFHHDAILVYLLGDYRVVLFDVEDKAKLRYIKNYVRNLLKNSEKVALELELDGRQVRHRLQELLGLPDRESIYQRCNFTLCITSKVDELFLPENSVDFMVSNCVLVHIWPDLLVPELTNLRRILADDGSMYHMLGHDDHWAFHDRSMPWPSFNYYRYSEKYYRLLFNTRFEYQNRLVKPEWFDIFAQSGLRVDEYDAVVTEQSREAIRRLPRLDARLAKYPIDDLAVIYSYVLLRKEVTQ